MRYIYVLGKNKEFSLIAKLRIMTATNRFNSRAPPDTENANTFLLKA